MTSDELKNSFYFTFERAERAYSAEMATKAGSDIHNSSIVNRHSSFDMLSFAVRLSGISYEALLA